MDSFKITLLIVHIWFLSGLTQANPVTQFPNLKTDLAKEVDDMNVLSIDLTNNRLERIQSSIQDAASFSHRDQDQLETRLDAKTANLERSLKYDVEILESNDIKKENVEIEERFRGPAIQMNTDTFSNEDIEVKHNDHGNINNNNNDNGADNDDDDDDDIIMISKPSHLTLTIILVGVAFVSIALYATLIIWRSHLEQRYGMRELLVNHDDEIYQRTVCSIETSDARQQQQQQHQQYAIGQT